MTFSKVLKKQGTDLASINSAIAFFLGFLGLTLRSLDQALGLTILVNETGSRVSWFSWIISFIVAMLSHRGKSFPESLPVS